MNKTALLLYFLLQIVVVHAQSSSYVLPAKGSSSQHLTPPNWVILSQTEGDLNRDGIIDLAFVIKDTNQNNIEDNDGLGADSIDTNPRILGIYFGQDNSAGYNKALQSNTFIIQPSSPTMNEPFREIRITSEGTLEMLFSISYNAGSWQMTNQRYQFVFQNSQFELHLLERNEVNRRSGIIESYSVNFTDGEMRIEKGSISRDKPESVETKHFTLENFKTLKSMKKPFTWTFMELDI